MIGELYDYTNKNEGFLKTRWYTAAMESQKPQWLNPSVESGEWAPRNNLFYAFLFRRRKNPSGGYSNKF